MKKIIAVVLAAVLYITLCGCGSGKFDEGYNAGYQSGYSAGYEAGYNGGYIKGYEDGYLSGYSDGYVKGYEDGYQKGYEDAYNSGYDKGVDDLWDELQQGYGVKPAGLDDPMPEIWEHEWDTGLISGDVVLNIDVNHATELTIGPDVLYVRVGYWKNTGNLENIYVDENNPVFASDNGVLYSKSFETLYKWPQKKPVTASRESIKYFARECFENCDMPEGFELPDGTISIGHGAFRGSNLKELHLKENVQTVGSAVYPSTIRKIEISAPIAYVNFFNNWWVETIIFNEGVKEIRTGEDDIYLTRVYLFYLLNLEFPDSLEAVGHVCFPMDTTVGRYSIPKNVKYIALYAFSDYTELRSLNDWEENPIWLLWDKVYFHGVVRKYQTEFISESIYAKKFFETMKKLQKETYVISDEIWDFN